MERLQEGLYFDADLLVAGHWIASHRSLTHFGLHLGPPQANPEIPLTQMPGRPILPITKTRWAEISFAGELFKLTRVRRTRK